MKKISKRATLYASLVLSILLTVTVLFVLLSGYKSDEENRHIATDYLRRIGDLDHRLRETVLEDHSFLLANYDALVEVTAGIEGICPQITALSSPFLFSYNAETEPALRDYCRLTKDMLDEVEKFKSRNSLLKNSLKYFPTLVAGFSDPRNRLEALALYSEVLRYCLQPTDALVEQMYAHVDLLNEATKKSGKDLKQFADLRKHAAVVVRAAADRQKIEAKIYSPDVRLGIARVNSAYAVGTDHQQARSKYFKAGLLSFSAVLLILLLVLIQRLHKTAESLTDLNENLEENVRTRTLQLTKALADLELQQQIIAHATKMSALGEMAGGIAHEINTPLAAISLKAEALMFGEALSDSVTQGLEDIIATAEKLAKIVLGLRRFSRDGGQAPLVTAGVSEIVDETIVLCGERFRGHGIDLRLKIENALLISCIPEQISQVLLNLLNNAHDAVLSYDDKWVEIEVTARGSNVSLRVTDSGRGITREVQDKMMQPFFTTKAVGQGTGIGLSISRGIIERHNGTLRYDDSSPNTAFEILIPQASYEKLAG